MKKLALIMFFSVGVLMGVPTPDELLNKVRSSSPEEAAEALRESFNTYFFGSREDQIKITKAIKNFRRKYGISPLDFGAVVKRVSEAVTITAEPTGVKKAPKVEKPTDDERAKREIGRLQKRVREQQKMIQEQERRITELEEKLEKKSKEGTRAEERRSGQVGDYIALALLQEQDLSDAREKMQQMEAELQLLRDENRDLMAQLPK